MDSVVVEEPERMNLLGHILASTLRRSMAKSFGARVARSLSGDVAITAGRRKMGITVSFSGGRVTIRRGASDSAKARIEGDLGPFIKIATGATIVDLIGEGAKSLVSGKIRMSGDPTVLARLIPLIRA